METTDPRVNRLGVEKSPYLLQHARNPVAWYPWSEEAFARARAEGKPIFLSIGYSTCHWCHVMAHESFEDERTAALLNEFFVPIKVDREERPDVDRIYMTALQAMGQNGGWPLSMFLTPDLQPFYGGTYFPPESRQGRLGFSELLQRIREVWLTERTKVDESASGIAAFLREAADAARGTELPNATALDRCFDQFAGTFDNARGGFGHAPKFPRPAVLGFLLRYHARTGNREALDMVDSTLLAIAAGGIHDQVGGGFHRYAVDAEWRVPHFEKMLYDQVQLLDVYLDAFLVTRRSAHARVARGIIGYLLRDLRLPHGGFASAEDADSPRPENPTLTGEGAFYLWTKDEVVAVLGEEEGRLFCLAFGVDEDGNAPFDPQQEFTGRNILFAAEEPEELARFLRVDQREVIARLDRSRRVLLAARAARLRPLRDDKVITAWNGLAVSALARAGAVLELPDAVDAAIAASRFLLTTLRDPSTGHLLRRYRDGEARQPAHLEDYAYLVRGLLDLHEATHGVEWLDEAIRLAGEMNALFHDPGHGGYFETTGKDPSVIVRMREHYDGAEPSGNSVAAIALLRLGVLTGDRRWREAAESTLRVFSDLMERQPVGLPNMMSALDLALGPSEEIVIVGDPESDATTKLIRQARVRFRPHAALLCVAPGKVPPQLFEGIREMTMVDGQPTAYVCRDFTCALPTTDPETMGRLLDRLDLQERV